MLQWSFSIPPNNKSKYQGKKQGNDPMIIKRMCAVLWNPPWEPTKDPGQSGIVFQG
jgi:hypothetical protein